MQVGYVVLSVCECKSYEYECECVWKLYVTMTVHINCVNVNCVYEVECVQV